MDMAAILNLTIRVEGRREKRKVKRQIGFPVIHMRVELSGIEMRYFLKKAAEWHGVTHDILSRKLFRSTSQLSCKACFSISLTLM